MSSQLSNSNISAVLIAKCSKCRVKCPLTACKACEEAKCLKCAVQHLTEVQERWEMIEENLTEINNSRKNLVAQNKNSLDSLAVSINQLRQTCQTMMNMLNKAYEDNVQSINDIEKIYQKKNERMVEEWKSLETNKIYKKLIENGYRCLLTEDPTELEILIERIQYCLQEESDDNNHVGKRFQFQSNYLTVDLGRITNSISAYRVAPRRLKSSFPQQYIAIEKRIARVTNSKRTNDDLMSALKGPLSTRETRMEVVAWIAVCQFNCRIFGGFVRDWIVGGYSAKPTSYMNSSAWITYTDHCDGINDEQRIPHVNKALVPNDIDCDLPDDGFDINQFLDYLRKYDIECGVLGEIQHGYVLLLDEHRSPFTIDLVSAVSEYKFYKHGVVDMDVNNLYVEKDYRRSLGIRYDSNSTQLSSPCDLETIIKNIQDKKFKVLITDYIEDRIQKMINRGWTQLETTNSEDANGDSNDESNNNCYNQTSNQHQLPSNPIQSHGRFQAN